MYRTTVVTDAATMARFADAAGCSANPAAITRQAPDVSFYLENDAGKAITRCSLWWQHTPPHDGHKVGFVGHYAVSEPHAAPSLLAAALQRLAAEGCTLAIGPVDGNTWQRYRLLTERGAEPPFFLEPDNPDDWPGHFLEAGFTPLAQYYSAVNDTLSADSSRLVELERAIAERGISISPLDPGRFEQEMRRVHALSLVSFRNNFLYTSISEADFLAQYVPIRPHLRTDLVLLAERGQDLVGFIFALPNLLQAQMGQAIDTAIIKTMAVDPAVSGIGLGTLLMARCELAVHAAGFRRAIHALFHETNRSGRISGHSARVFRRYTLYARSLEALP